MGNMNTEGMALIADYKIQAITEMTKVAIDTESQVSFLNVLYNRLRREDLTQVFAVYPTSDLPIKDNKDQYLWDWGIVCRDTGYVSINGGILYSVSSNEWSTHT